MSVKFAPGEIIDGFTLGAHIHAGAMGDLFRVTHPQHAGSLVMKAPRLDRGDRMASLLSFETEALILPELTGPHVPKLVATGDLRRAPYLVLETIDGEKLEDVLRRGPLPAGDVARIAAAVADALHAVHRQDVIHFDLKPANILLRSDGSVVLIDFGLSHHARLPDLLAEEKRDTAGSAPYVSPEQVEGSRTDPRSDLYALGAVLYEMATGALPFGVPTTVTGTRDRLWREPRPPRARVDSLPPWLQEIILRCLEVDADARYQTAAHVAFDLRNPAQVPLTNRAEKLRPAGILAQFGRWWRARNREVARRIRARAPQQATPVIMVAIDTTHPNDERQIAIRRVTDQMLAASAEFRLLCLSVIEPMTGAPAASARDQELEHLVRLRHWVDPLQLSPERLSLHVVEAGNPAVVLLDFARRIHADLIIVGAPSFGERDSTRWRSVASAISARATCSVHIVRLPAREDSNSQEEPYSLDDVPQ
jgi:nucleotide-binding universal stress UspA family protein